MVNACIYCGCDNISGYTLRLHAFPRPTSPYFRQWMSFVQTKRKYFSMKQWAPHVRICSAHFKPQDYIHGDTLQYEMGSKNFNYVRLNPDAVPSIHSPTSESLSVSRRKQSGRSVTSKSKAYRTIAEPVPAQKPIPTEEPVPNEGTGSAEAAVPTEWASSAEETVLVEVAGPAEEPVLIIGVGSVEAPVMSEGESSAEETVLVEVMGPDGKLSLVHVEVPAEKQVDKSTVAISNIKCEDIHHHSKSNADCLQLSIQVKEEPESDNECIVDEHIAFEDIFVKEEIRGPNKGKESCEKARTLENNVSGYEIDRKRRRTTRSIEGEEDLAPQSPKNEEAEICDAIWDHSPSAPEVSTFPINMSEENQPCSSSSLNYLPPSLDSTNDNSNTNLMKMMQMILKENQEIKSMMKDIKVLLEQRKEHVDPQNMEKILDTFNFPMSSEMDVHNVEELIEDQGNSELLLTHLNTLGGVTPKDVVDRMMAKIMTNSLACFFNWSGKGEKLSFGQLKLTEVIIRSAKNSKITESKFEIYAKKWLKNSSDRDGGRKRRLEMAKYKIPD